VESGVAWKRWVTLECYKKKKKKMKRVMQQVGVGTVAELCLPLLSGFLFFVFCHNLKNSEFHVLCWKLNRFGSDPCGSYGFYFLSKEK
jgi:hypothetical protein